MAGNRFGKQEAWLMEAWSTYCKLLPKDIANEIESMGLRLIDEPDPALLDRLCQNFDDDEISFWLDMWRECVVRLWEMKAEDAPAAALEEDGAFNDRVRDMGRFVKDQGIEFKSKGWPV